MGVQNASNCASLNNSANPCLSNNSVALENFKKINEIANNSGSVVVVCIDLCFQYSFQQN